MANASAEPERTLGYFRVAAKQTLESFVRFADPLVSAAVTGGQLPSAEGASVAVTKAIRLARS
jgi:hypothetical protein